MARTYKFEMLFAPRFFVNHLDFCDAGTFAHSISILHCFQFRVSASRRQPYTLKGEKVEQHKLSPMVISFHPT